MSLEITPMGAGKTDQLSKVKESSEKGSVSEIVTAVQQQVKSPKVEEMMWKNLQLQAKHVDMPEWMSKFQARLNTDPTLALPKDHHSNFDTTTTNISHAIWSVNDLDFTHKVLSGQVEYSVENKNPENRLLVLDAHAPNEDGTDPGMTIEKILISTEESKWSLAKWEMAATPLDPKSKEKPRPDALRIILPTGNRLQQVKIIYKTSPKAPGLFWRRPELTDGKEKPMVFSQFEETLGASVIPGAHSPAVRMTSVLNINTGDPALRPWCSVKNNPNKGAEGGQYEGLRMDTKIPMYLMSLSVGEFACKELDEKGRCGIAAEKVMIEKAANAFWVLPKFMEAAEDIMGPYTWGVYWPILLTLSYPYGAMEHACASFFGGDCISRLNVLAHELAHSWSGNNVTNCDWGQFSWNEGLTSYVEKRICSKVLGDDYALLSVLEDYNSALAESKEALEARRERMDPEEVRRKEDQARLISDYNGSPPTISSTAYGKGTLFWMMLEDAMGREELDAFLKGYNQVFTQRSMSDNRFLAFLKEWLENKKQDFGKFCSENHIDQWLYGVGFPPNTPKLESSLVNLLKEATETVCSGADASISIDQFRGHIKNSLMSGPLGAEIRKKGTEQQEETIDGFAGQVMFSFLTGLAGKAKPEQLEQLDAKYSFSKSTDPRTMGAWSIACSACGYLSADAKDCIKRFLPMRNSNYYSGMICTPLSKSEEGQSLIRETLLYGDENKMWDDLAKNTIKNILQKSEETK